MTSFNKILGFKNVLTFLFVVSALLNYVIALPPEKYGFFEFCVSILFSNKRITMLLYLAFIYFFEDSSILSPRLNIVKYSMIYFIALVPLVLICSYKRIDFHLSSSSMLVDFVVDISLKMAVGYILITIQSIMDIFTKGGFGTVLICTIIVMDGTVTDYLSNTWLIISPCSFSRVSTLFELGVDQFGRILCVLGLIGICFIFRMIVILTNKKVSCGI